MQNKNEIQELEKTKSEIFEKLETYYKEVYELNQKIIQLKYDFPTDFRNRQFKVTNGEKTLTFGKGNLVRVGNFDCGVKAFQVKRNGTYYTNSEIVEISEETKVEWIYEV